MRWNGMGLNEKILTAKLWFGKFDGSFVARGKSSIGIF